MSPSLGYVRHPRGNGKLFDSTASLSAFISPDSILGGESVVAGSSRVESSIVESSFLYDARIVRSRVFASSVAGAQIFDSLVCCDCVAGDNAFIKNSWITGDSEIKDDAIIENSTIHDFTVFGSARLTGVLIENGFLGCVSRGLWTRAPRIYRFENIEITVTESVDGFAFVGCQEKPIDFWLSKHAAKIGRASGWSTEQIEKLHEILKEWRHN